MALYRKWSPGSREWPRFDDVISPWVETGAVPKGAIKVPSVFSMPPSWPARFDEKEIIPGETDFIEYAMIYAYEVLRERYQELVRDGEMFGSFEDLGEEFIRRPFSEGEAKKMRAALLVQLSTMEARLTEMGTSVMPVDAGDAFYDREAEHLDRVTLRKGL